ncbi:hypothetical protein AT727_02535 [Desulfitobacterium hafniense]|uniref:Glycosyltransferase 2-like domain-containing protein n=1 Tax=Desulfitobacterium hafniense TaxID=49338 RepID=A0A0W1JQ90_DESHA|nr:glycosyltransferase [Desulfitobacterium hafniense]KTE93852.1 hypothetical protein AT727_02535 [Desulfitobacterium hafniense]
MSDFPLVTVGLISNGLVNDIIYTMNTILLQDYPNIEIIVSFDSQDNICIADIINAINANRSENIKNITIHEFEVRKGLGGNIKYIVEHASGEYITFLLAEDAYYDKTVLLSFINLFEQHSGTPSAAIMKTAIFHSRTNSWEVLNAEQNSLNTGLLSPSICYRRDILISLNLLDSGIIDIHRKILDYIEKNRYLILTSDQFIGIKHTVSFDHHPYHFSEIYKDKEQNRALEIIDESATVNFESKMNYTSFLKFSSIIGACIHLTSHTQFYKDVVSEQINKVIQRIDDELEFIVKRKDGYWRMTDSNIIYLNLLKELRALLCISFRREQLFKLMALARDRAKGVYSIVFFVHEYSVWPSLQSVYEASLKRYDYRPRLVYIPFFHELSSFDHEKEIAHYVSAGYNIIRYEDYNLSEEGPDIVVYVKPYESIPEKFRVKEVNQTGCKCIYIPYGMETANTPEGTSYQCYSPMQYLAWRILAYSQDYYSKIQQYTYTHGRNYLKIGHPRMDLRFEDMCEDTSYRMIKTKARNRKIVMWNTHFTLSDGDNWGTYLLFGDTVLNYFENNKDLFLLWRPHPLFFKALAQAENKDITEVMDWFAELGESDHILIDRFPTYLAAFAASDALLTDITSFVPEYAVRNKKMLITKKPGSTPPLFNNLNSILNVTESKDDIILFLDDVLHGMDYFPNRIQEIYQELYLSDSETVAQRLLNYIDAEIKKECEFTSSIIR